MSAADPHTSQMHVRMSLSTMTAVLLCGAAFGASEASATSTVTSASTLSRVPEAASAAVAPADSVQVAWDGDRLAVRAVNAPLAIVLDRIHQATGVSIEIEGASSERVTVDVGPASVRRALQAVLDRSQHDYILVSPAQQSQRVERIVVIPRASQTNRSRVTRAPGPPNGAPKARSPILDLQHEQDRQQHQFQQTFGACIAQGCDAS